MSRENVETARCAIEAYNRGGVNALDSFWHADIEFHDVAEFPDAGVHHGLEAAKHALQATLDTVGGAAAIDLLDMTAAGDEVLYRWQMKASGTSSGIPIEAIVFHVATIRNGKVVRFRQFLDRDTALKAAGLSE